jgi:hypothetical protein
VSDNVKNNHRMSAPVRKVEDPYQESDVGYLIVDGDTVHPDIVEVEKGTSGSYRTLQEAKSVVMEALRARIEEGTTSLDRIRRIGVTLPRLM